MLVNVTVENLAPCKKLLRVELESKQVDDAFEAMTKDFQRQVSLPGFRPGKAPRDMVVRKYADDIRDEVKKKLIPDAYRKAIQEHKLSVVGYPDIEEIQFAQGQALQFAATVETSPEFELPDYKGLPVKKETGSVSNEDVERAIELLRERQTNFNTALREAKEGDVAVVNYTGTCDGKPLTELSPTAKGLTEQKNFWINVDAKAFIPGFGPQLAGAKAGDKRTVTVDFPTEFVSPELAGKKGVYEVEVVEVKEKVLPPMDDAFAKSYGAETLDKLREGVRSDLENELKSKQERDVRNQVVDALLNKVNFELPESVVMQETRSVVYNIVSENQRRGIAKELIDQQKEQIFASASHTAKGRVKASFLFSKVAEKEGIKAEQMDIAQRVQAMAASYQMPMDKFVKELEKRDGFGEVYEQVLNEKVIQFLVNNAAIEEVAPAPKQP